MPRVLVTLTVPTVPTALTAPLVPTATSASTPARESTLLVRIPRGQTHKGVSSSQSVSQFKSLKSHSRCQAVEVYSFGHSVDSVDSFQSKSDLINRYVYYDTRAFIYQIGSQNLSKIKAILILSDVTSVCD